MLHSEQNIFEKISHMFKKGLSPTNPKKIPAFWKKKTGKPSITFTLTEEPVSRSYIGGPNLGPVPVDADGQPMRQLCALYCSELPPMEGFPKKGILRFFLAENDDMALDPLNPTEQNWFRVLYQQEETLTPGDCPPVSEYFPVQEQYFLQFTLEPAQPMTICHWDYDDTCQRLGFSEDEDEMMELLEDAFPSGGHRIGGYPHFTQDDPRYEEDLRKFDTLLLQLDTEDDMVEIGDCGVLNFFIPKDNLKNLDFSEVLYWWDCY